MSNELLITNPVDEQYFQLMHDILKRGTVQKDRTGTGTISLFGAQMRFDLKNNHFPLLTSKKIPFRLVSEELLWFLRGETNVRALQKHNVNIWDEWADKNGQLGPVYGYQWRSWPAGNNEYIDQLSQVIDQIKNTPYSRRHIVSAWNVAQIDDMALPPCHMLYQFNVSDDKLSCQMYQRSADMFLGVPFNIASYALLTRMVAQVTNLKPGELIHTLGNYHIYLNHIPQVMEQLSRNPRPSPTLELNPDVKNIDKFTTNDFIIKNYNSHPSIKAPISV